MAREAGAEEEAIAEAIEVGRMVRRGAANRLDKETAAALEGDT